MKLVCQGRTEAMMVLDHRCWRSLVSQLPESLLAAAAAAQILGVSESFLAKARMRGTGPRYRKLGRTVRYAQGALNEFLLACSRTSTADQQATLARQRSALPQAQNIPPP